MPAGQGEASPLPQDCCNSQIYWGWSCDTHQGSAGYVQAAWVVVFKIKPAQLGWVGLQSQVPTTALQPLEIKMGLSLEHESCTGAAKAPSRLLMELCPWPWGAGMVSTARGVGRDGDPIPQVTPLEDEHTPLHPFHSFACEE